LQSAQQEKAMLDEQHEQIKQAIKDNDAADKQFVERLVSFASILPPFVVFELMVPDM
jgi:hypothetical protein